MVVQDRTGSPLAVCLAEQNGTVWLDSQDKRPMRTSRNDPLRIAEVSPPGQQGVIGITLCPGKKDPPRGWDRDLEADLAAIRSWGAEAIVTLIEENEMVMLKVTALPEMAARHGVRWLHLPIRDICPPDHRFEAEWAVAGPELRRILRRGGSVLVHCRGGLGRAGTVAARLLVEMGLEPAAAIAAVRQARLGAIETPEQEAHVLVCRTAADPRAEH
jgi:protein-tyrosine phosphatase